MAILSLPARVGTQSDVVGRLRSVLPGGWFPDATPVLDGVFNGLAAAWSGVIALLRYTQAQTRIATASDIFLDLIAQDYFGTGLMRAVGEPDASLRARIARSLLPDRATRAALTRAVTSLTGRAPRVFEPARLQDTGAYGVASTLGYGVAGGWGSFALPFQVFVQAYRPLGIGVARCGGYGSGAGGYGVGAVQYTTPTMQASTVLDQTITQAIAGMMPAAVTAWVNVRD